MARGLSRLQNWLQISANGLGGYYALGTDIDISAMPCPPQTRIASRPPRTPIQSKSMTIEKNVLGRCGPAGFYDFDKFVFVLGTGLATPTFDDIPQNDFTELRSQIDAKCG